MRIAVCLSKAEGKCGQVAGIGNENGDREKDEVGEMVNGWEK